jgi:glycosyltransferase involved in cell wall biosynthesis
MPKRRVALVSHSRDLAGAELCLLRLAEGLRDEDLAPVVILPGAGPLASKLRSAGIEIASVTRNAWWIISTGTPREVTLGMLLEIPRSTWEAYRVLRDCGVEVVGSASSVVPHGALAAKLAGVPHVWHVRELYPSDTLHPVLGVARTLRAIGGLSTAVVAPSSRVGRLFESSTKLRVIPEGIDRRFFEAPRREKSELRERLRLGATDALLAVVGTLESSKNQIAAIRALASLRQRGTSASIALCGSAPDVAYREALAREALALGVSDHVHFLGFQPDTIPLYDAADALLVVSRSDSFGLTIVEAMARGVPVVATRCGGPEELVVDGETGFLVPVDDVEACVEKLVRVLGDAALARRLGDAGRVRARAFGADENLRRTLGIYGLSDPRPHPQR